MIRLNLKCSTFLNRVRRFGLISYGDSKSSKVKGSKITAKNRLTSGIS